MGIRSRTTQRSSRLRAPSRLAAVALLAGATMGAGQAAAVDAKWREIPPAPITGRSGANAVWTGTEMLVWGAGTSTAPSGGAAYNPATRAWRRIATAPTGVRGAAVTAWTGREMVVWASNPVGGPVGAAAYAPATDTWRPLPAGPLGEREGYRSVWTGTELIVMGGTNGDTQAKPIGAALDPARGTWRALPALDKVNVFAGFTGAVWDGRRVYVSGVRCVPGPCGRAGRPGAFEPFLARVDPATGALEDVDLSRGPVEAAAFAPAAWTGKSLVVRLDGGAVGEPAAGAIAFTRYAPGTASKTWRLGRPGPCAVPNGDFAQTAWLGPARFVAPCGADGLQIYTVGGGWRQITAGPSPLNSRSASAIVWTGREIIAWSGSVPRRGRTPNQGASLFLGP